MHCLVTGAAGFIGSHLAEALISQGHSVVGVDCFTDYYPRSVKEANLACLRETPSFTFAEADLRSADLAPLLDGVDAVFHQAAMAGLVRSWTEFDSYMTCNLLATQRLLEAAKGASVKHFVHASTSSVYGREATGDETHPLNPVSPYGVTKLAAENLVRSYGEAFSVPFTILRYFSVYGPRQRPDMGIHILIDAVLNGKPMTVFGDGEQTRGNTYISDAVAANLLALAHGPTGEAFNIGGGSNISWNRTIALVEQIVGRPLQRIPGPPRAGGQRHALADTSKAQRVLGWQPAVDIETGLRAQVEWQRG
ncbi:MAG: NAD-dependent epimerase/dehydratase family protein [Anaerolineae bacterium]